MFLSISYPPLLPSKMSAVQVDCFLLFLLHFPLLIQFHCTFCTKGIFHLSPSLYKCKCKATPNLNEILMCFWVAFSSLILMTKATLHLAPWFLSLSNHVSLPLTFFFLFFFAVSYICHIFFYFFLIVWSHPPISYPLLV